VPTPTFQPPGTVAPDEATIRDAEAAANADSFVFTTAQTIEGTSAGLIGDGRTDNTQAFRTLLAGGDRTIHIAAGDYVTDKLSIDSKTILRLDAGVIIRDAGRLGPAEPMLRITTNDVRIEGLGAKLIADRTLYTTGEWRHGVYIFGAQRVVISGLESSDQGGDGFYIGGPSGNPSVDVILKGCSADNNRRQGLSITSARRVTVVDSDFDDTQGTAPEFGVDLEPNDAVDVIDRVVFVRPHTASNAGGDFRLDFHALDATSETVSVAIIDHTFAADSPNIYVYVPSNARATLLYSVAAR
jgi:hypothetical protein